MTQPFCQLILHYTVAKLSWMTVKSLRRSRRRLRRKICDKQQHADADNNGSRTRAATPPPRAAKNADVTPVEYEILQGWTIIAFHSLYVSTGVEYFVRFIPCYFYLKMLVLIATFLIPSWAGAGKNGGGGGNNISDFGLSPFISYWFDYIIVPGVHKLYSIVDHNPWGYAKTQLAMLPLLVIDCFILPGILATDEEKQLVRNLRIVERTIGCSDVTTNVPPLDAFPPQLKTLEQPNLVQEDEPMLGEETKGQNQFKDVDDTNSLPEDDSMLGADAKDESQSTPGAGSDSLFDDYLSDIQDSFVQRCQEQNEEEPFARKYRKQNEDNPHRVGVEHSIVMESDDLMLGENKVRSKSALEDDSNSSFENDVPKDTLLGRYRREKLGEYGHSDNLSWKSEEMQRLFGTPPRKQQTSSLFDESTPKRTTALNSILSPAVKSRLASSAMRLRRFSPDPRNYGDLMSPNRTSLREHDNSNENVEKAEATTKRITESPPKKQSDEEKESYTPTRKSRRKRRERLSLGDHFRELVTGDANIRVRDHLFDLDLPTSPRRRIRPRSDHVLLQDFPITPRFSPGKGNSRTRSSSRKHRTGKVKADLSSDDSDTFDSDDGLLEDFPTSHRSSSSKSRSRTRRHDGRDRNNDVDTFDPSNITTRRSSRLAKKKDSISRGEF